MKSKGNNIIQMTTAKILYNNLHSTGVTVSNAMSLQVSLEKNKVLPLKKKILQSATSQKKKKNTVPQITSLPFELSKSMSYYTLYHNKGHKP